MKSQDDELVKFDELLARVRIRRYKNPKDRFKESMKKQHKDDKA